jgi:hypothetical protein
VGVKVGTREGSGVSEGDGEGTSVGRGEGCALGRRSVVGFVEGKCDGCVVSVGAKEGAHTSSPT